MIRRHWKRILLNFCAVALLTAAYQRIETSALMAEAANAYLSSLSPELREKAVLPFAAENRDDWHFIPLDTRKGVALREMTPEQKHLAQALLSAGLSQQGIVKAHTVMSLDEVLRRIEGPNGRLERDPEKYYLVVFGAPAEKGTWGYAFEGHHVSVNFTIVDGKVAATPNFFGANPAEIKDGARKGLRTLKREEDLARQLVKSLNDSQRKTATIEAAAPRDILTGDERRAKLEGQPQGLTYNDMTAAQRQILGQLVGEYAHNFPEEVAADRLKQFEDSKSQLYFAWAGGIERGEGHYYRVQTPKFLIEYDNIQNNNNHIHSVWRDFIGDFGDDLLALHYKMDDHSTELAANATRLIGGASGK